MAIDAKKVCTKCREALPITSFHKDAQKRDGLSSWCNPCKNAATRAWQRNNPDKLAANTKRYKERHRERLNKRRFDDRQKHHAKRLATARAWVDRNRAKVMAKNKRWQEANREAYLLAIKLCGHRQRGRGTITKAMVSFLKEAQRNMCVVCRVKLGTKSHIDHIVPLARGGDNSAENLQLLCPHCNQQKSARDPIEFMQSKGFLL